MVKKLFSKFWNSPTLMTWGNMLSGSIKLLILTPLILRNYNVNEIALWYLLLTVNTFAIVIDFGFYPTFSRVVSYAFNGLSDLDNIDGNHSFDKDKPNWDLMGKIYGTINSTYLLLGIIVFFVVFGFSYFSISEIINRTQNHTELWLAYFFYILSVFVSFYAKKFDAVIIGTNNIAIINRWDIINTLIVTFTSIAIVFFKLSLFWLSVNQLFFAVVLVLRDFYIERKICNGQFKMFHFFSFDKQIFRWCWEPTWKSGVLILCSTGVNQASGFIYAHYSNSLMLASYLLSLKLISTVSQFSQAPFYSKLTIFSGLRVQNKIESLIDASAKSMKNSLIVFVIGASFLLLFGNYGLTLIGSHATLIDGRIMLLICWVLFLERHHAMHAQIYVTTNKISFFWSSIISAAINVMIIIILLPIVGIWSFPIAQGISNLAISNWWNVRLSIKSLNVSFKSFFIKSALIPTIAFLIISIVTLIKIFI
jgi:hypothetical protein